MARNERYERERGWHEPRGERYGRDRGDEGRSDRGRPHRIGDRDWRGPSDDPYAGTERYGGGAPAGYGSGIGPTTDPDSRFGASGYDPGFGGPRFDRIDVGSTGTHGVHPVSSPYGADYRGAVGMPAGALSSSARQYAEVRRHRDPDYDQWRQRRIEELDRDYEDYCRENQWRFDREFGTWRDRRGQQRQALGRVREHMEVIGSDGEHVGTVDHARRDRMVLTRSDPSAGGMHHTIPCGWIDGVDERVRLDVTAEEARERWQREERSGAMFEPDRGRDGPHVLNRSFSGTYPEGER